MLTLPPGKYFIGDPCYVFDSDKPTWDLLLGVSGFLEGKVVEFQGHKLWAHCTSWGDGVYKDQHDNEYDVDSGLLGAVPIALIEDPSGEESGRVIDAPNGLSVSFESGTFFLGNTVIPTDEEPDEDPYSGDPDDDEFV